tara:strand:+ start:838 stop:1749 length:912 start_codon:yes stop_codon:yes gene_type:complete
MRHSLHHRAGNEVGLAVFTLPIACVLMALGSLLAGGCAGKDGQPVKKVDGASIAKPTRILRLATTTSTADTGLIDHLLPAFESEQGARVDVIAAGTGQAMKLGERGDVDVLLVHARDSELAFVESGHAIRRDDVMYNEFLLLGPDTDPARVRGRDVTDALARIRAEHARFVSRGDESGTHKREQQLWRESGGLAAWDSLVETGRGMGQSLVTANEMEAYILCDRGTYLKFREKISLRPVVEGDKRLHNPYGILVINPQKHPSVNSTLADAFADYLLSAEVQQKIAEFRVGGEPLFHPHPTTSH